MVKIINKPLKAVENLLTIIILLVGGRELNSEISSPSMAVTQ
jgi:hypothetical protein